MEKRTKTEGWLYLKGSGGFHLIVGHGQSALDQVM